MRFTVPMLDGSLIRRYKRFLADVRLGNGRLVTVHCPNPGSMLGLAEPGWRVLLSDSGTATGRKLRFTWEAVRAGRSWVIVNTLRANQVAGEALRTGLIAELADLTHVEPEVRVSERSRIDFRLSSPGSTRPCYVEVKSVTLREDGVALFPDAVTLRGRRHLEELALLRRRARAVMLFLVMRADCRELAPADAIDPEYGRALRRVTASGVEVLAYDVHVSRNGATVGDRLPVRL
jgi:sugar fermentation stimulation protein A